MIFEAGWVGRWARNLQQSRDLNAVPIFFRDNASGQTFAQAFDLVATQLRSGGNSPVIRLRRASFTTASSCWAKRVRIWGD
ncbi:MAG: hypothetical protein ACREEM_10395 [Blastocatellia bacterium]